MKIGIIGFGRFGKFIVKHLAKDFNVYVFDKNNDQIGIKKTGAIPSTLEDVCKKDVIILCIPISKFKQLMDKIKNLIKEDSIIVDVCSVKEYPVEVMIKTLPNKVQILATHPMFGPDSAANSIKGKKVVLCKIRISDNPYQKIKVYLQKKGLIIIETTPKEHDIEIAKSQVLTHFIGRALFELGAKQIKIDTEGYKRLLSILQVVKNDSLQLFEDMNRYNKYSKNIRKSFINSIKKIDGRLKK